MRTRLLVACTVLALGSGASRHAAGAAQGAGIPADVNPSGRLPLTYPRDANAPITVGGLKGDATLDAASAPGHGQRLLSADGQQAYAQIQRVLGTAPETLTAPTPGSDSHHARRRPRPQEARLHLQPARDARQRPGDRVDRQRLEIKTDGRSPAYVRFGRERTFRWLFKLPPGFQPSTNFTHIHQLKAFDGDAGLPIITLTPRKGDPNRMEIIHVNAQGVTTKLASARLEPVLGQWVEAYEKVTYGHHGKYSIVLRALRDGTPLLEYANDDLDLWRTGTTIVRPKWGIYRSLKAPADLRDESVSFDRFCLAKGTDDCASGRTALPTPRLPRPEGQRPRFRPIAAVDDDGLVRSAFELKECRCSGQQACRREECLLAVDESQDRLRLPFP